MPIRPSNYMVHGWQTLPARKYRDPILDGFLFGLFFCRVFEDTLDIQNPPNTCWVCLWNPQKALPQEMMIRGSNTYSTYPKAPCISGCMEYLPTLFTINLRQMRINIPYIESLGVLCLEDFGSRRGLRIRWSSATTYCLGFSPWFLSNLYTPRKVTIFFTNLTWNLTRPNLKEEKHLPSHHFQVRAVNLRGCIFGVASTSTKP